MSSRTIFDTNRENCCFTLLILILFITLVSCESAASYPLEYKLTTIVGASSYIGSAPTSDGLSNPQGVSVSPFDGKIYYTDTDHHQVKCFTPGGNVQLLAGSPSQIQLISADDVLANSSLSVPKEMAFNSKGEVILVENGANKIRRIYFDTLSMAYRMITLASKSYLNCVAVSKDDQVYTCSTCLVGKIVNGQIINWIGDGSYDNSGMANDTPRSSIKIETPQTIGFHPFTGQLFFSAVDAVRYVDANDNVKIYASIPQARGISFNGNGDLYVSDFKHRITKVDYSTGAVKVIANEKGIEGFSGDGGNATQASFNQIYSLSAVGNYLYLADAKNNRIRRIDLTTNIVTTVAGQGTTTFLGKFNGPQSIYYNSKKDELFIADTQNYRVSRLKSVSNYANSSLELVLGTGKVAYSEDGKPGDQTSVNYPCSIAQTENGDIYVGSQLLILKIDNATGIVSTFAGSRSQSKISFPILYLNGTDLFASNGLYYKIMKIPLSNTDLNQTIAGTSSNIYNGDNIPAITANIDPYGIVVRNEEVIFASLSQNRVRKINGNGTISTIAGTGSVAYPAVDNIPATQSTFQYPESIAYLPNGELVIADTSSHVIRKVDKQGIVSLIAGKYFWYGNDGDAIDAKTSRLYNPKGLVALDDGRILFSDSSNNLIRMLTPYCKKGYIMEESSCWKETFSLIGAPSIVIIKDGSASFNLILSKVSTTRVIWNNYLSNSNNSYIVQYSFKSNVYETNETLTNVNMNSADNQTGTIFPTRSINTIFSYNGTVSFVGLVTLSIINLENNKKVSYSFTIRFQFPPQFPTNVLSTTLYESIALTQNITTTVSPWSASSDLYPLKYAITFVSSKYTEPIRITEFSDSLNQSFVLPFLGESLTLGVTVMDGIGNIYSKVSEQVINVLKYDGTFHDFSDISFPYNLITALIYDQSFSANVNFYQNLMSNIDVSDVSSALTSIQVLVSKTSLERDFANSTITKLGEIVSSSIQTYTKSKSENGYVNSKIKSENINYMLQLCSDTMTSLDFTQPRQFSQKVADLVVLGEVSNYLEKNTLFNYTTFTSSNINLTISTFIPKKEIVNYQNQEIKQESTAVSFNTLGIVSQYSTFESECAISLLSYSNLLETNLEEENSTLTPISITTDFKFMKNQKVLNLENLESPIVISFALSDAENQLFQQKLSETNLTALFNLSCAYLDETSNKWSKKGCYLSNYNPNSKQIDCACNHTTLFTTFLEQKTLELSSKVQMQVSSIYYTQIAFGAFYFVCSGVVLVLLIVFRKAQPVSSRLITPFLGIIALMLETSLVYIVQRSVLVDQFNKPSTDWASGDLASNWISNIVLIIVNTMQLVAILAYLLQVARFQLMKYLYRMLMEIRRKKRNQEEKLLTIIRNLTGRKVFYSLLLIFGVLNICYWTLWVILVRTGVLDQKTYSYIVSISYIVIIFSLGSLIVLLSILDWTISSLSTAKQTYSQKENSKIDETKLTPLEKVKHQINSIGFMRNWASMDTPLYFRIEMILFTLSFVMIILNQSIGLTTLSSRYENELGYLKIQTNDMISVIFELIYMALQILVYGGFCLLVLIFNKFRKGLSNNNQSQDQDIKELVQLIENDYGFSLFEEFCRKEFSTENLYLYQDLRNIDESSATKEQIEYLYNKYIKNGAEMEVNLPSECSKTFANLVKSFSQKETELKDVKSDNSTIFGSCLSLLKDSLIMNLADTFSRFIFTSEFKVFSQVLEIKLENEKQMKIQ